GTAELGHWRYAEAEPPLREAYVEELRAGDYRDAVEAFARYAWIRSRRDGVSPEQALAGVDQIAPLAEGLPRSARFAQALLHNNLASIYIAAGDSRRARDEAAIAVALASQVRGPGTVELSAALHNLALVTDEPKRRDALFAERIAVLSRELGPDHASVLA